jgi:TP901-1 family phage major tail protein
MAVNNNAMKGALITLEVGDGASPEAFTAFAGSRSVRFSLGGSEIDVTTADDIDANSAVWSTYISGVNDFSASFDGVMKTATTMVQAMQDRAADTVRNYQLVVKDKFTISGPMRITTFEGNGEYSDAATYSVTIRAASALTITAAT